MKGLSLIVATALAMVTLAIGCSQATPAPTQAPAAPPKVVEPTKAPAALAPTVAKAAEPTKAPAAPPKVNFPEKGKTVSFVVAFPPGGGADLTGRVITAMLEKEFGIPVQVVNKGGAAGQVGFTEVAKSKPDGYNSGMVTLPSAITAYMDPDRGAAFKKSSFEIIGMLNIDPGIVTVRGDSPIKSIKDLIDAAKANPKGLKIGTDGLQGEDHMAGLQFEQMTGTKFSYVHFDGGGPAHTALLGGHVDVRFAKVSAARAFVQSGQMRALAINDKEEAKVIPGVKTMEAQGYKLHWSSIKSIELPAGVPKDIVQVWVDTYRKIAMSDEWKQKNEEMGFVPRYMNPAEFSAFWDEMEGVVQKVLPLTRQD